MLEVPAERAVLTAVAAGRRPVAAALPPTGCSCAAANCSASTCGSTTGSGVRTGCGSDPRLTTVSRKMSRAIATRGAFAAVDPLGPATTQRTIHRGPSTPMNRRSMLAVTAASSRPHGPFSTLTAELSSRSDCASSATTSRH